MPVQPDSKIVVTPTTVAGMTFNDDITNLINLANGKADLPGTPYSVASYHPDELNDRGAWSAGTYNAKDKVTYGGYDFVATATTTLAPLDGNGVLQTGWSQMWLAAYNRIRSNLLNSQALGSGAASAQNIMVSGPWPFASSGSSQTTGLKDLELFFADAGAMTLTLSAATQGSASNEYIAWLRTNNWTTFGIPALSQETFDVIVGGSGTVQLNGKLSYVVDVSGGTPSLAIAGTFPAPTSVTYSGSGVFVLTWTSVPCAAGSYTLEVNITNGTSHNYGFSPASPVLAATLPVTTTVAVNGIHCTKAIKKISAPPTPPGGVPFGLWMKTQNTSLPITGRAYIVDRFTGPSPTFYKYLVYFNSATPTYTASYAGLWSAITPPIRDLKMGLWTSMPWNLFLMPDGNPAGLTDAPPKTMSQPWNCYISGGNWQWSKSYLGGFGNIGWETEATPPARQPLTWYPLGFQIRDDNGNLQTCVQEGFTGAEATIHDFPSGLTPAWPVTLGSDFTEDTNSAQFQTGQPYFWAKASPTMPPCKWRLTKLKNAFAPTWPPTGTIGLGTTVYDSNGNTQESVSPWIAANAYTAGYSMPDSNGNTVQVITGGTSGSTPPTWPTVLNDTVTDGTVTWKLVLLGWTFDYGRDGFGVPIEPTWATAIDDITQDATIFWKLTAKNLPVYNPGRARMYSVPAYPVIWDNDTWLANTPVRLGQRIRDTNGEIRICSQPGTTGATQPSWGSGGTSGTEPQTGPNYGMVGSAAEISDGTAKWRPYLAGFAPRGWWIYRVNINKITPLASGNWGAGSPVGAGDPVGAGGSGTVMVDVGIYRNGSFVSFGSYPVGSSVPAMWPIFTNTPLVYQCSERVDVQASIIACGTSFSSGAGAVSYPLAAAFYNDVENLLNQIN